jgi:hypothetical protein
VTETETTMRRRRGCPTREEETRLAQYELPAFRAGAALAHVRKARAYLHRGEIESASACLTMAEAAIGSWMEMAQAITSYPYAAEVLARERQKERRA